MLNEPEQIDFDPYNTLKTLYKEVKEIQDNLSDYMLNQKILDKKLDAIYREIGMMPKDKQCFTYEKNTVEENQWHEFDFDCHHDSMKEKSNRVKQLLNNLKKKGPPSFNNS